MRLHFEPTEIARFGRRMARLKIAPDDTSATAADIVQMCEAERVEMLTVRVPTHNLRVVQNLEDFGFRLMDCLVNYEAYTVGAVSRVSPGFSIRKVLALDTDEVCEVARACFACYSSHYTADRRLDREKILEGYIDWTKRSCNDRSVASTVLIAMANGRIVGFGSMKQTVVDEGEAVLFGVHPNFAGLGIYSALIDRAKAWCLDSGLTRMTYATQLDNLRAQRTVSNRGFRLFQSYFTFHRWFV